MSLADSVSVFRIHGRLGLSWRVSEKILSDIVLSDTGTVY